MCSALLLFNDYVAWYVANSFKLWYLLALFSTRWKAKY